MAFVLQMFVRRHSFALLNALFWLVISLEAKGTASSWLLVRKTEGHTFFLVALWVLPGCLVCALLHRQFCHHSGWMALRGWRRACVVIACLTAFVALLTVVLRFGLPWLGIYTPPRLPLDQTLASYWIYIGGLELRLLIWAGFYLLILGSRDLQLSEQRRSQQAQSLLQAQLRFLTSAFQPHFLMNGLNAIVACRDQPQQVQDAATALADYLRYALESGEALEPLGRQLRALQNYVTVQELRFGDRLCCRLSVDAEVLPLKVPRFLLQPLVENACKHGVSGEDGVLRVQVRCRRHGDRLVLSVRNSGGWMGPREDGYGLEAVRKQLQLHYGSNGSLRVSDDVGVSTVTLDLPAEAYAKA